MKSGSKRLLMGVVLGVLSTPAWAQDYRTDYRPDYRYDHRGSSSYERRDYAHGDPGYHRGDDRSYDDHRRHDGRGWSNHRPGYGAPRVIDCYPKPRPAPVYRPVCPPPPPVVYRPICPPVYRIQPYPYPSAYTPVCR